MGAKTWLSKVPIVLWKVTPFYPSEPAQCGNFTIFLSLIHIVREINFDDSECARSAIFAILETLEFEFYDFLAVFEGWNLPHLSFSKPLD